MADFSKLPCIHRGSPCVICASGFSPVPKKGLTFQLPANTFFDPGQKLEIELGQTRWEGYVSKTVRKEWSVEIEMHITKVEPPGAFDFVYGFCKPEVLTENSASQQEALFDGEG